MLDIPKRGKKVCYMMIQKGFDISRAIPMIIDGSDFISIMLFTTFADFYINYMSGPRGPAARGGGAPCLERARVPNQKQMGPVGGVGPVKLGGAPDEEPMGPYTPKLSTSGALIFPN